MSDVSETPAGSVSTESGDSGANGINLIEIDLSQKAEELWKGRKTIMVITGFFFALGLFHYIFTPEQYTSTATLIQEVESGATFDGGSAFLRSLTGGSFQSGGGNLSAAATGRAPLPATMYPIILHSTDFQKDLIYRDIEFMLSDTTMTLYDYYDDYYKPPFRDRVYSLTSDLTIFLPYTLYKWARSGLNDLRRGLRSLGADDADDGEDEIAEMQPVELDSRIMSVTREEVSVINRMRLQTTIDIAGGLITLTTTLPDPKAAAMVNAILLERIQEYITDYRVEKARLNLEAINRQLEEARLRYEEAQNELAEYQDQNLNLTTNVAQTRVQHLQNQRNIRFNVYNSIAQEVEQARMVLEQQIPVFNVLEKPDLPRTSATGSSNLQLVFSIILGVFFGMGWVLLKNTSLFKKKDTEPESPVYGGSFQGQ